MRFSIVVPLYNDSHGLKRLLYSLKIQSFKSFEVIIVDDGSTQDYSEILSKYQSLSITYVKIDNTGSPSVPRNRGLSLAIGEYVCFLDSDDFYNIDALFTLDKNVIPLSINFFLLQHFIEKDGAIFYQKRIIGDYKGYKGGLNDLFEYNYIPTSGVCIYREDLLRFDAEPFKRDVIEDWHLWLSLVDAGFSINKLVKVLGYYKISTLTGMSSRYSVLHYYGIYAEFKSRVGVKNKLMFVLRFIYIVLRKIL